MDKKSLNKLSLLAAGGAAVCFIVYLWKRATKKRSRIRNGVIEMIGDTPMVYIKSLSELTGCKIYGKCEFLNPGGSIKDRTALSLIEEGMKLNILKNKGDMVTEGTSGSTGISLTLIANYLGFKSKIFVQDDVAPEKIDTLSILGAEVVKTRPVSIIDEGHYCKRAEREAREKNGYYANQFENLGNYRSHYNKLAREIWEDLDGKVDIFVASAGTGGSIAGVSRFLKEKNQKIKVVLADPPGSSLHNRINFGVLYTNEEAEGHRERHPFDTITEGIGVNRLTRNFAQSKIDFSFKISDVQCLHMAHYLIQNEGLFLGSSSALNLVAVVQSALKYGSGKTIVTVLCDSGTRYLNKFYSQAFIDGFKLNFRPLNYRDLPHKDLISLFTSNS